MKKILFSIFILITFTTSAYDAFAETGQVIMKARIAYFFNANTDDTQYTLNGVPKIIQNSTGVEGPETKDAKGAVITASYFFNDYLAVEGSLGMFSAGNYELGFTYTSGEEYKAEGKLYMYPTTVSLLYYPAPYGELSPYIGAGYNFTFMKSTFDGVSFDNSNGASLQAGFDWWFQEEIGMNINIEKTWMNTIIDYTGLVPDNLTQEVNFDPLILSAGVALRF